MNIILERTRLEANADPALRDDETCSLQPNIHEEISKLKDCTRGFMGVLLVQHLLGTKVALLGFGGEGTKTYKHHCILTFLLKQLVPVLPTIIIIGTARSGAESPQTRVSDHLCYVTDWDLASDTKS